MTHKKSPFLTSEETIRVDTSSRPHAHIWAKENVE